MAGTQLKTLVEIFNHSIFRIPDYQRGYAWEKEQLEAFWDDLGNLEGDSKHYTGLLTVEQVMTDKISSVEKWQDDMWMLSRGYKAYYVIDGQQRLTTIIILLNEILNKFNEDEEIDLEEKSALIKKYLYRRSGQYQSFIFGYERDNPSDEYFRTKILQQHSVTADNVPEETLYTANLRYAKQFFERNIENYSKQELGELFRKVTNSLKFNFYEIDEELDVFVTFETMNNRGKPLSKLELLKNRLIYLTTLLSDSPEDRNKLRRDVNDVWKKVYEYLGKNKDNPLDDDVFLRNHWIMYFTYNRSISEAYADFLLNEHFTANNIRNGKIKFEDIKNYIDSIYVCIKNWFYIFNPKYSRFSMEVNRWLEKLNRLGFGAFPPLLMAALHNNCKDEALIALLKEMERFQFLVFRISRRQSNVQNNNFYRMAHALYDSSNPLTVSEVIEQISELTDGEDEENYYGWYDIERFQNYIKEQFSKDNGFYSWNGLKYFLYEYELHLQEKANGHEKVNWEYIRNHESIEHIMPQDARRECWTKHLRNIPSRKKRYLLHSLGNLVLISQSKNSALQNQCFSYKKKHEHPDATFRDYFNGSYSEIEVAQYQEWTSEEILNRGIRLLEFMENRWQIEIDNKEELLCLDFLDGIKINQ